MEQKNIKLLLIEGDIDYTRIVQTILDRSGAVRFESVWSDCLSDGLERSALGDFDLVLLDLNLPDSRGFDTFLRTLVQVPDIPIIVLTGTDGESLAVRAVQMGAHDYLIKRQLSNGHLVHSILYAIKKRRARMKRSTHGSDHNEAYFRDIIERNADGVSLMGPRDLTADP
jgi:DNA-binding NtrC family response regulator